jgi:hypothetical protein
MPRPELVSVRQRYQYQEMQRIIEAQERYIATLEAQLEDLN